MAQSTTAYEYAQVVYNPHAEERISIVGAATMPCDTTTAATLVHVEETVVRHGQQLPLSGSLGSTPGWLQSQHASSRSSVVL
ncbi:hypothetical protein CLCR_11101 [Cladophialophora carrionii]|uniref:Uncharacterized protein n=1 Tax=Cladophialophora carrionii TaxID=86049 RepID=A0A1C1CXI6_9EURO|nr:hypothetical protein CLCR_11101 [Cladophialophora carrionii]